MEEISFYAPEARRKAMEALEKAKELEANRLLNGYKYVKEDKVTVKLKKYRIMEEKNEYGHRKTEFDGRKARVLSPHPHEDATAICIGADYTTVGWGLVFKREDTEETFFVFYPTEIQWLK